MCGTQDCLDYVRLKMISIGKRLAFCGSMFHSKWQYQLPSKDNKLYGKSCIDRRIAVDRRMWIIKLFNQ